MQKPKAERDRIHLERELERYLSQSHISDGNLSRLGSLAQHADPAIREHAALLYDIGIATPYKRRRFKRLAREHRDLLTRFYAFFGRADFPNAENEWLAMIEVSLDSEEMYDMDDMEYWGEIDEEEKGFVHGIEIIDPFAD